MLAIEQIEEMLIAERYRLSELTEQIEFLQTEKHEVEGKVKVLIEVLEVKNELN